MEQFTAHCGNARTCYELAIDLIETSIEKIIIKEEEIAKSTEDDDDGTIEEIYVVNSIDDVDVELK